MATKIVMHQIGRVASVKLSCSVGLEIEGAVLRAGTK
jgi:hypothetical protein